MLTPFDDEIWIADGPAAVVAGFRYPTRMVIIRLAGGGLFVCSPIALTPSLRGQVDALGPVQYLVEPNRLHHLHLAEWQKAYPGAKAPAPPGLRRKRPALRFDDDLTDFAHPAWAHDIDQVLVRGNLIATEVVFFHRASRTAIFTDLLQNFAPGWFSGLHALSARLDLMIGAEPRVPRKFRLTFVDRRAARASLRTVLSWPSERVLAAHATPVTADGQAFLRRAFRWLIG